MLAKYALHVFNTAGTLKARLTDFLWLSYTLNVNRPGLLRFRLRGDHDLLASVADNWELELWRRPAGGSWAQQLVARLRDETWTYEDGGPIWQAYCPGILTLLGSRIVNWPAGTANRSYFDGVKAETAMKTLVDYNAGANATTTNGRKRTGTISGLTVQTDAAGGNTETIYCHGDNLLETLQELAATGGGDFSLAKTGAGAYQFRWHTGQLGTDRTATVLLALERGNMADPVYEVTRSDERTVACVWGQGVGAGRDYVTRTGADYSSIRDYEMMVDARNVQLGDTTGLQEAGDKKLEARQAQREFTFEPIESNACRYGEHYFLGDLVKAKNPYTGAVTTQKIDRVLVTLQRNGAESIRIRMGRA